MLTHRFSPDSEGFTRLATFALCILLALGAWRLIHPSTTFATDGIDRDWDRAVAQSRSAHEPAVVLFSAGWCPACQALHADTLSRTDIQNELNANFTFLSIDLTHPTPSSSALAHKLGVSAIPTLIRYDRSGKETDRTHYLPPEEMLAWLRAGE